MPTISSSNSPVMAITNNWYDSGTQGGITVWKTSTAYVGWDGNPRELKFTFPALPTENITINNVVVNINISLEGIYQNRTGVDLVLCDQSYSSPVSSASISSGWTEDLTNHTIIIPAKGKYAPTKTTVMQDDSPSSQAYITFTATIEYSYNYVKLSAPADFTISATKCLSTATPQLSWSAVSNGEYANTVSGYAIYNGTTKLATVTTTSYTLSSLAAGTANTYYVQAISSASGYDSDLSSGLTLQVYGDEYSAAIKLYTADNTTPATTITVGAQSVPQVTTVESWTPATYDSVLTSKVEQTDNVYTLTVNFESGRSTTATATVATLGAPLNITFSSQPAANSIYGSNITYKWNAVTSQEAASIKYVINNVEQDSTSYTQDISTLARNTAFTLQVTTRAYAPYGGYTDSSSAAANTVYRANSIEAGTVNVTVTGEGVSGSGATAYVAGNATISWSYTPATRGGDLKSISYNRIASSTYNSGEIAASNEGSYIDEVSGITGDTITYTVTLTDEYGQTYTSANFVLNRIDAPTVIINNIVTSQAAPLQGATLNFTITPSGATTTADIRYNIEVGYEDEYYTLVSGSTWSNDTSRAVNFNVKTIAASGSLSKLYTALTRTDSLAVGKPTLIYRLSAYDINTATVRGITTAKATADFTTVPTITGTLQVLNISKPALTYASSKDTVQIGDGITVTHKNYFGDTTTSFLTNTLVRNSAVTLVNEAVGGSNFPYSGTLSDIQADTFYTYTYTVSKQYADASVSTSVMSAAFPIKKFIAPDVMLTNLAQSASGSAYVITGRAYSSTPYWGGSSSIGNIYSITAAVYSVDDSGNETKQTQISVTPVDNLVDGQLYIPITFTRSTNEDIQLKVKITCVSTSMKVQESTSATILLKDQGAIFAIRKYGIGVNASSSFNPTSSDTSVNIVGNTGTDTAMMISNGTNRAATDIVIKNDNNGSSDIGQARLSLQKDGTKWTLSVFFD